MTENEAIKEIRRLCCNEPQYYLKGERKCKDNCMYGENFCAFQVAIKALEEVQKYRKLGTVEEVRELASRNEAKAKIKSEYKSIFFYQCPVCEEIVNIDDDFCDNCGQRLESEE